MRTLRRLGLMAALLGAGLAVLGCNDPASPRVPPEKDDDGEPPTDEGQSFVMFSESAVLI